MNHDTLIKGSNRNFSIEFIIDDDLAATVSSVAWTVTCGTSILTISNKSLSSNTATATINAVAAGCAMVKITPTLSNGEVDPAFIKIRVLDPKC